MYLVRVVSKESKKMNAYEILLSNGPNNVNLELRFIFSPRFAVSTLHNTSLFPSGVHRACLAQ
jgi:hypothetical protein